MIVAVVCLLFVFSVSHAGPTFLGIGRGSGSGMNLAGASFELNPAHVAYGGVSAITGKTLHIDLEKLDISVSHGLMSLSRSGFNFTRGQGRWRTEYFDERMEITRNNHSVIQFVASDRLDLYNLKYNGMAHFSDIVLDKTLVQPITIAYCKAERKALGRNKREIDACSSDSSKIHPSGAQMFEQVGKILVAITEASHTSAEEVHNRLKGSYEDAVKSVVSEFNQELSSVKVAHAAFSAWQEKQREALNSMSNVEEVVQSFKDQLTSNLIFVEDRQEEIFTQISNLTVSIASNLTDVEMRLSELVNSTLPLLVDATKNATTELVDSKLEPAIADISRIEAALNGSLSAISTLNERQHILQRETNASFGVLSSALDSLNATIAENYLDVVGAITDVNQSLVLLGSVIERDVETKLANLTQLMDGTNADLAGLAAQHDKSNSLVSESISALNSLVHTSLEELRNVTSEALASAVSESASNYTQVLQSLGIVNASLQARADVLLNATHDLFALIDVSSEKSHEQLNEAVNNISISIANSNSIFAKVVKELNSTLTALSDNHVALQTSVLPGKIEDVAKQSSADLMSAVAELTALLADGMELVQWEAAQNLTGLHRNLTQDMRNGLDGLNTALLTIVENQKQDKSEVYSIVADQGSNHSLALLAAQEQIYSDLSVLNATVYSLSTEASNRVSDLNSSMIQSFTRSAESLHNSSDALHSLITNRTDAAYQQIASLDGALLAMHRNLTKQLYELEHSSFENVTVLHELLMQELESQVTSLRRSLNDTSDALAKANMSLTATIEESADSLQKRIRDLEVYVNSSQQTLQSTMLTSEEKYLALWEGLRSSSAAHLAGNISAVRTDMDQALVAIETAIHGVAGQTASNLTNLYAQVNADLATVREGLQAALNVSILETEHKHGVLQDSLQKLHAASNQNFSAMLEHIVFETDYTMSVVNASRQESAVAVQRVSDQLQSVNISLSQWTNQVGADFRGIRELIHDNMTNVLSLMNVANTSFAKFGERTASELANITAAHKQDVRDCLVKIAELNKTHELNVGALLGTLDHLGQDLSSRINSTRSDLQQAQSAFSTRLDEARDSTQRSVDSLNVSLTSRFGQLIASTDSQLHADLSTLESKVDAQHAAWKSSLSELAGALNVSAAKSTAAHSEITKLYNKSVHDIDLHIKSLQGGISDVKGELTQLGQREASERHALLLNLSQTLGAFKQDVSQTLSSAEAKTNTTLLQQQVLISGHTERLNSLHGVLEELKFAHNGVAALVTNQSSTLAVFRALHTQHSEHATYTRTHLDNLTSGVVPSLTASLHVLSAQLEGVQKTQESSRALQTELLAGQLQQSANISYLTARLNDESSARKEQDVSMHAFFSSEWNRTTTHTSQMLSAVQETVSSHAEKIATVAGQTKVLASASEKYSQDIDLLKGKAASCEATASEVVKLTKQVDSLQAHIREQDKAHQRDMEEMRASFAEALGLIKALQGNVEKQGDKLDKVATDAVLLQASSASKEQVDQLKDKVAEVQQGVVMQATSALQLVQSFYQQQQQQHGAK